MFSPAKLLEKGIDMAKETFGAKEGAKGSASSNPIFGFLEKIPGFGNKAEKVKEGAEAERASLFEEIAGSALRRMFPSASKWLDLGRLATGKWAPESHPLQNEIAGITAFSAILPDSFMRPLTDFFVKSEMFQKAAEWAPMLPDEMKEEIKKGGQGQDYDPDKVIEAVRILNQDIGTVLAGVGSVKDVIGMGK